MVLGCGNVTRKESHLACMPQSIAIHLNLYTEMVLGKYRNFHVGENAIHDRLRNSNADKTL